MSNFLYSFLLLTFLFQNKSNTRPYYLLASSIATATATCHVKQPAVVSNHGVVTSADESHHLSALVSFETH